MTVVDPHLPVDVLDDPEQRTPIWDDLREQEKRTGVIPRGTYEATLREVTLIRRKDNQTWVLRLLVRTDHLGQYVVAWRGLSENPDDPYDLTENQVKGLRKFADQLGIQTPAPAPEIIDGVRQLLGKGVTAKVVHTPVGPQTTLSRSTPGAALPAIRSSVDLEGAAREAHIAHEKVMEGLSAARLGFTFAAEGCHALLQSTGWVALGFETLNEYLASPEVTLTRSEFYRLAAIWENYIIDGGLQPILLQTAAETKLEVPLPALNAGVVDAEQALADATSMNRRDLRAHYTAIMAGDDPDDGTVSSNGSGESRQRDGATVPVSVARTFAAVLRRIMFEVGAPEKKRMSTDLREALLEALALAQAHSLDVEDGPRG